jgi:hypothetical protein
MSPSSHRRDGDLEMVVCLEWRNWIQAEVRTVPGLDGPLLIERGDPHPYNRSNPTHPPRTWDRVRGLEPRRRRFQR